MGQTTAEAIPSTNLHDIIFTEVDLRGVQTLHNDAVVVSMTIANNDVKKCLVDNRSFIVMNFYDCFFRI